MKTTQLQIMQVLSLFCAKETTDNKREWMEKPFQIADLVATTDGISSAYIRSKDFNFSPLAQANLNLIFPSRKSADIDGRDLERKLLVFEGELGGCRIGEAVFSFENLQKLIESARILDNYHIEIWDLGFVNKRSIFGIGDFRFMLMPLRTEVNGGVPEYEYLFKLHLEEDSI